MPQQEYIPATYDPRGPSLPQPIIAHTHEVVLPVEICKEFYPILRYGRPLPYELRKKLRHLFETTPVIKQ